MITQSLVCVLTSALWRDELSTETSGACYCAHLRGALTLCPAQLWAPGWLQLPHSSKEHINGAYLDHTWPAAQMLGVDVCLLGTGTQTCGGQHFLYTYRINTWFPWRTTSRHQLLCWCQWIQTRETPICLYLFFSFTFTVGCNLTSLSTRFHH